MAPEPPAPRSANRVIFACVQNAGRSQIASAFFNLLSDQARASSISAGTQPAQYVNPVVAEVMKEIGIDLSQVRPRLLTRELAAQSTLLITMGCGDSCPVVPGLRRDDWVVPDPQGLPPVLVRKIRDAILQTVRSLLKKEGWERPQA